MKEHNWMAEAEQFADALFGMTGNIITAFISRLAPFVVPLAPAFFFAHSIYGQALSITSDQGISLALGVIAAVGLEIVGIMAAHRAVDFYSRGERDKARAAAVITAVYLLIGIGGIILFENTTFNAKVTGVVMFIIAGMVYLLLGLSADSRKAQRETIIEQEVQGRRQAEQIAWERQLELEKMRLAHELKLKRLETKPTISPTVSPTVVTNDWRKLSAEQKTEMVNYSTEQIVDRYGVSDRTAERWQARSRQLSVNGSTNGVTK
jgi:multisubunit Na+/H+ antiporter MnhG subunit